VETLQGLQTIK
ncbi:hypothetical protein CP8484711_1047B, partial [Chlamydia psittaci 84-8471/1]